ncbi:MAG: SH3 domain-containing protein [Anaerolineae bacterium]|nr:SH3 domain-containing protein [Anaerolineae bacterium]
MSAYIIPLGLAFLGLIMAFSTYRNIRRGGARFYTLEREAVLRRSMLYLAASVFFFMLAIGYLIYTDQPATTAEDPVEGQVVEGEGEETAVTTTPDTLELETFPPTPTITATPDINIPTATPTPIICRAVVEGTSGNGLTLRDTPGGGEVIILPDGSILTLYQEEAAQESGGFLWRKVKSITGEEGWVAEDFIRIGAPCE